MPKAISIGLACFIIAGVLFIPQPADALFGVDIGGITEKVAAGFMSTAVWGLLWMLGWIGWAALVLGTVVLEAVMSFVLQAHYTPLTAKGEGVEIGWLVIRDFTNMLFILVLIAIGVGTMLRLRIRGAVMGPQLLIPFALIAILINFTPLLTGIVIDIANILTKFFFDSVGNGMNAFINENPFRDLGEFSPTGNLSTAAASIFKLAVGIVFNLVEALIFLMVSALLVIRVLALWLLVIFSPLAFLLYILPQTRQYFQKWWSQFLQWAMLPVPIGFFIWLSVIIMQNGSTQCGSLTVSVTPGGGYEGAAGSVLAGTAFCDAVISAMALGTLLAGMFAAFAVSAAGSGFIVSQGKAARAGTQRWANRKMKQAGKATGKAAWGATGGAIGGATSRAIRRRTEGAAGAAGTSIAGSHFAKIPIVGNAFRAGGRGMQQFQINQQKEWQKHQDRYKELNAEQLLAHAQTERDIDKFVAVMDALVKKDPKKADEFRRSGAISSSGPGNMVERFIKAADNRIDAKNEWVKRNPHDLKDIGRTDSEIQQYVQEELTRSDLGKLTQSAVKERAVAAGVMYNDAFTEGLVNSLTRNDELRDALSEGLIKAIDQDLNPASANQQGRINAMTASGNEKIEKVGKSIDKNGNLRRTDFLGQHTPPGGPGPSSSGSGRRRAAAATGTAATAAAAAAAAARARRTMPPPTPGPAAPPGGSPAPSPQPSQNPRFSPSAGPAPAGSMPPQPNTNPGLGALSGGAIERRQQDLRGREERQARDVREREEREAVDAAESAERQERDVREREEREREDEARRRNREQ